jgi:thiamine biosynthesis protein ThiI
MKQTFLVKYAEIGIKGKNRGKFEEALIHNILLRLKRTEGTFTSENLHGRIIINAEGDIDAAEITELIRDTFGVAQVCLVDVSTDQDFESIASKVIEHVKNTYEKHDFTFKVMARRADKNYPMDSPAICREAGARLLDAFPELKVDVHDPDYFIWIEIRDKVYIYSRMIKGIGGMPLGTNGKSMLLLSGGIDSPVAGYMVSRRGVYIDAVYFSAPPYTSERATKKVIDLAKTISRYTGMINLHIINFTEIQMYIYEKCPHDELTIIMRRYMMKIAEILARKNDCLTLITGESIGQVASQTAMSLVCTDAAADMPVFRPLIAFDKQDIVDLSEKIGTYDISIEPYEDCCTIFVAEHPVTKPKLSQIEKSEKNIMDKIDEMVQKAVDTEEVMRINP